MEGRSSGARWSSCAVGLVAVAGAVAPIASANFTNWHFESYPVLVNGAAYAVIDVYGQFDGTTDTVLNVFNGNISNLGGAPFHHSDLSTLGGSPGSWSVQQSATNASVGVSAAIDSFVLVGGPIGSSNTTALDPNFSSATVPVPPTNAGWYDTSPPNLQGRVDPVTRRTFVARFVKAGISGNETLRFASNAGYNQGLGTTPQFAYSDTIGSGPTFDVAYANCDAVISPATASFTSIGGSAIVSVTIGSAQCPWTASTGASWISFPSGSTGTGSGQLQYAVAANPSAVVRTATISVNGGTHAVTQAAAACAVTSIDDPEQSFPVGGGSHVVNLSTNGPSCSWQAVSSAPWVTITSGASGSGSSGSVSYSVAANPNAVERSATVLIGTLRHTVNQAAAACAVSGIGDASESFPPAGGSHVFTVSTNGAVCSWSASSSAAWVTIIAGGSGTGSSGAIVYQVDPNPIAAARTAQITVGGFVHSISQAAAPCVVLGATPPSAQFEPGGGSGSFSIATNGSTCPWQASSSASWVVVTSGSGSGLSGTITYSVLANPNAAAREATITVGAATHVVSQAAAPCATTGVSPTAVSAPAAGGTIEIAITTNGGGCGWTASTTSSWISLGASGGQGSGTLSATIAANPVTLPRSGSIVVDGLTVSVEQAALPCATTGFVPAESTFGYTGGGGSTTISTNGANCGWTATSSASWITIVSGGTGTGASGTVGFEVATYSGVETRQGMVMAGSVSHLVTQTGGTDCNQNGLGDAWEIANGVSPDCNANGIIDSCDIASGQSPDLNVNGIPDECEVGRVVTVPGEFPTIQAAIDGSVTGWIIKVSPGTYNQRIALGNRQITVESLDGPAVTTIDGNGLPGSVVTMIAPEDNSGPGPTLRGFTIRSGTVGTQVVTTAFFGGGGLYAAYSRGTVENCVLRENSAQQGGASYLYRCRMTIRNTTVIGNQTGGFGGGLLIFRGGNDFEDCVIEDNFAVSQGGGVHLVGGETSFTDTSFTDNETLVYGGGLSVFAEIGKPDAPDGSATMLLGCLIEGNLSVSEGGGLWVRPGFDSVFIQDTTICNNEPDEISGDFTDLGGNSLCLCPGDITGNGQVNGADLAELLAAWGPCAGCPADINRDGIVNGVDLAILLGGWGACPTAPPLPWATVIEAQPDPAVVTNASLRAAITATGLPWRVRDNASQIEMVLVPGGTYSMGCSASQLYPCNGDENPVHPVTLTQPYYLGRYEVTQAQWTAIMGSNPSQFQGFADSPSRPVERVNWVMIQGFESATGLRLPSEAEWEFACRGGTTTAFNNGSNADSTLGSLAWISSNAGSQTRPVGQKLANALGLFDMHGNVYEWCEDWYGATYYSVSPSTNPLGPASGDQRVLRGGSWGEDSRWNRSSARSNGFPGVIFAASDRFGFRVARNP